MSYFQKGGLVKMSDGQKYMIFAEETIEGKNYVFLMTIEEPLKVIFAEEVEADGKADLRVVEERAEKEMLLRTFAQRHGEEQKAE